MDVFNYISQFGTTGIIIKDNSGLNYPYGVSIDSNGNIYIVDTYNHRLVKLNSNMEYISQFGTTGVKKIDNTGLNKPMSVDIDSNGNLYITDYNNHRLVKLNSNMEYVSQFGITGTYKQDNTGLQYPYDVSLDSNGNIYITDVDNHRLVKLNSNMEYISQFGTTGVSVTDNMGLNSPYGVSVDSNGNIYISDRDNHRLVKLNSNMEYISQFGITGTYKTDNTGLYYPADVSLDNNGNIYIADQDNHRLVKLNSDMEYVSQFGTTGVIKTDNTGLNSPYGVSLDNNNIYIADTDNHRIVKLSIETIIDQEPTIPPSSIVTKINRKNAIADKETLDLLYNSLKESIDYSEGKLVMEFITGSTVYSGDLVTMNFLKEKVESIVYVTDPLFVLGVALETVSIGKPVKVLLEGTCIVPLTNTLSSVLDKEIFPNSRSSSIQQMVVSNFEALHEEDPNVILPKPYCIYNSIYNDLNNCKVKIINPYTNDIYYIYNQYINSGGGPS